MRKIISILCIACVLLLLVRCLFLQNNDNFDVIPKLQRFASADLFNFTKELSELRYAQYMFLTAWNMLKTPEGGETILYYDLIRDSFWMDKAGYDYQIITIHPLNYTELVLDTDGDYVKQEKYLYAICECKAVQTGNAFDRLMNIVYGGMTLVQCFWSVVWGFLSTVVMSVFESVMLLLDLIFDINS